eukprot:3290955-Rhodomonas_salina.1
MRLLAAHWQRASRGQPQSSIERTLPTSNAPLTPPRSRLRAEATRAPRPWPCLSAAVALPPSLDATPSASAPTAPARGPWARAPHSGTCRHPRGLGVRFLHALVVHDGVQLRLDAPQPAELRDAHRVAPRAVSNPRDVLLHRHALAVAPVRARVRREDDAHVRVLEHDLADGVGDLAPHRLDRRLVHLLAVVVQEAAEQAVAFPSHVLGLQLQPCFDIQQERFVSLREGQPALARFEADCPTQALQLVRRSLEFFLRSPPSRRGGLCSFLPSRRDLPSEEV